MPKFTITRSTGIVGVAQNVAVYLNGELVDKLANNESKTLILGLPYLLLEIED